MKNNNTPSPSVLVFDSGVGGLSVFQEIRALLPTIDLIYACDNKAFPYGNKAETHLLERVLHVQKELVYRFPIDLLVLACNSASTVVLPHLREELAIPVVGVVPAIKPAALASRSKVIGLLATEATVERQYTQELIDDYAEDCDVISVGSQRLVEIAEYKLRNQTIDHGGIEAVLSQLFSHPKADHMDTVVLGCTHFPLLRDELAALAPQPINWIDSGSAIARRVQQLLATDLPAGDRATKLQAAFTQACAKHQQIYPYLRSLGIEEITIIDG